MQIFKVMKKQSRSTKSREEINNEKYKIIGSSFYANFQSNVEAKQDHKVTQSYYTKLHKVKRRN